MITKVTKPNGWSICTCTECGARWTFQGVGDPPIPHTVEDCLSTKAANAELVILQAQYPGATFKRKVGPVLNGSSWEKV